MAMYVLANQNLCIPMNIKIVNIFCKVKETTANTIKNVKKWNSRKYHGFTSKYYLMEETIMNNEIFLGDSTENIET